MNPLVSVVIPTYNRRELVFRALESVFEQTYRPLEVIVIDDCSHDGTREAVLTTVFPIKVNIVQLSKNQGPAAARNAGILRSAGKYVALLDSDDVWLPQNLEHLVYLLEASFIPEKTVAFGQVWIQRKHDAVVMPHRAKFTDESIADYLFSRGGYVSTSAVAMSTTMARETLYDSRLRIHEDWDFYLRLEEHGAQFVMLPIPLGITFDTEDAGRASAPRPHLTLRVLEEWQPKISQQAYLGLRARTAPQLRREAPLRALGYIIEAYLRGGISAWFLLTLIGTLMHPKLRELAYFIRGHISVRCLEYRHYKTPAPAIRPFTFKS